jgi:hypothetical protein
MEQDSFVMMGMNIVVDVRESKRQLDKLENEQKQKHSGIGKKKF